MNEAAAIALLCATVFNGAEEVRHDYDTGHDRGFIRVDCENRYHVIELGLDKRSSFDSLHQVLFAAELTGKTPLIVIVDTDLREGRVEYQIRTVAEAAGVAFMAPYIGDLPRLFSYIEEQTSNPSE